MKIIYVLAVLFAFSSLSAQSFVGLWEIYDVSVGREKMTPVAKWMRINEDLSFESGNGWTKNSEGQIQYNKEKSQLEPVAITGLEDAFGPFEMTFENEHMLWKRDEEGTKVIVRLRPIDKIPKGPADKVQGLWKAGQSDKLFFVRPDKRYRIFGEDGEGDSGIWHMDGHRPIMTLISGNQEKKHKVLEVKFEDGTLLLKEEVKDSSFQKYSRLTKFPD